MNSMVPVEPTVELVTAVLRLAGCEKWNGTTGAGWEVIKTAYQNDILVVMHRANTARGASELLQAAVALNEHWKTTEVRGTLYVALRTEEPTDSRWKWEILRAKFEMAEGRRIDLEKAVATLEDRLSRNPPASWVLAENTAFRRQIESMTTKIPDLTAEIEKYRGALRRIKAVIPAREWNATAELPYGSTVKGIIKIVKEAIGE